MQHKFSFFLRKIPGIEEYLSEIENTIPILTYTGNNWQTCFWCIITEATPIEHKNNVINHKTDDR